MFITVKFGNNESILCNPSCVVINLLTSIKRRAGYGHGNPNVLVDLSDESGLVKELDLHRYDLATKYLVSHGTYVLVEKQMVDDDNDGTSTPTPNYHYVPLLNGYRELFPNYNLHVAHVETKKKRMHSKSPSPAGKMVGKTKKGQTPARAPSRKR